MTDRLTLWNAALALLEQPALATAEGDTMAANECRTWYGLVRQGLIRAYPWSFALRRALLPADATPPAFGWLRAFPWPAGALAIVTVDGLDDDAWTIEGNAVLTDAPAPLTVRYLADVVEEGLFDPVFADALVIALARRIAPRLARSDRAVMDRLAGELQATVEAGWRADAIFNNADLRTPPADAGDDWARIGL